MGWRWVCLAARRAERACVRRTVTVWAVPRNRPVANQHVRILRLYASAFFDVVGPIYQAFFIYYHLFVCVCVCVYERGWTKVHVSRTLLISNITAIRFWIRFRLGFDLTICIKTSRHHIATIIALRYMRVHRVVRLAHQPITGYGFTSTVAPSRSIWDLMSVAREQ